MAIEKRIQDLEGVLPGKRILSALPDRENQALYRVSEHGKPIDDKLYTREELDAFDLPDTILIVLVYDENWSDHNQGGEL